MTHRWVTGVHLAFLWVAVLAPPLLHSTSDFRVGQRAYLATTALLALVPALMVIAVRRRVRHAAAVAFLLAIVSTMYFMATTVAFSGMVLVGDLPDLLRPLVYAIFFTFPIVVVVRPAGLEAVARHFVVLMLLQIALSALVFLPSTWPLVDIYKGRPSTDAWTLQFLRFSGTFGFPGSLAMFLTLAAMVTWHIVAESVSRWRQTGAGVVFLVLSAGVFLTGSRAGIVALVLLWGVALWDRRRSSVRAAVVVLCLVVPLVSWPTAQRWVGRRAEFAVTYFARMVEFGIQEGSAAHRIRELPLAWDLASRSPPFGLGPNRDVIADAHGPMESMYGHYLAKFGWLGLLLAVGHHLGLTVFIGARRREYELGGWAGALWRAWVPWAAVSVLLLGAVTAPADQFRGVVLYYYLAGHLIAALGGRIHRDDTTTQVGHRAA